MFTLALAVIVLFVIAVKVILALTNFHCETQRCLIGKVAIVTGGNSGMGNYIVHELASRGCKVIIADVVNGETIAAEIRSETENPNVFWQSVDLGSLDSVRKFAEEFKNAENRLDILINNAGCSGFDGYTKDGLQKVMQINYFGHFLLTHLLLDLLKSTENSRVVSLSSHLSFIHCLHSAEEINSVPSVTNFLMWNMTVQYANSKLCLMIAMKVMAEKLRKHNVLCYSVHPGLVNTAIFSTSRRNNSHMGWLEAVVSRYYIWISMFIMGKTVREGAQVTLHCALSKEVENFSGQYYSNGGIGNQPSAVKQVNFCLQVWKESERLVKLAESEKIQ